MFSTETKARKKPQTLIVRNFTFSLFASHCNNEMIDSVASSGYSISMLYIQLHKIRQRGNSRSQCQVSPRIIHSSPLPLPRCGKLSSGSKKGLGRSWLTLTTKCKCYRNRGGRITPVQWQQEGPTASSDRPCIARWKSRKGQRQNGRLSSEKSPAPDT